MIRKWPSIDGVKNAAIIYEMRGKREVSLTFINWIQRYATKLHKSNNIIFLAELEPGVKNQLEKIGVLDVIGKENIFLAQPVIGASFRDAIKAADEWVKKQRNHNSL